MRLLTFLMVGGLLLSCAKPGPVPPNPNPPAPIPVPPNPPIPELPPCGFDEKLLPVKPTLINGTQADPAEWPASVYARAGNSACSSTVIGERVLLSAGHCMKNGKSVTFTVGANNYTAKCTHHPEYKEGRGNSTADWALCLIDKPVVGAKFEMLATKHSLQVGEKVRLTGYGCIRPGGGGGNDGVFRIGEAEVMGLPGGNSYDVSTRGGAALCFGDSGGAAYIEHRDGKREVFGVNSRGDIRRESYLPDVTSDSMQEFTKEWIAKNNAKICGVSADAKDCRTQLTPPPPPVPPFDFEVRGLAACVRGKLNKGHEGKKDELVKGISAVLNK